MTKRCRIFWAACCLLSWFCSYLLIHASWEAFQNNAISFATETNYLDWNSEFPAVGVCESDNDYRIDKIRSTVEPPNKRNYVMDDVYKEITYFYGAAPLITKLCYDLQGNYNSTFKCPTKNMYEISSTYRSPCDWIFGECSWRGEAFNCCQQFSPLLTEVGMCYMFNSFNTKPVGEKLIDPVSNRSTGPGALRMQICQRSKVYVIARQEVPTPSLEREMFVSRTGSHIRRFYSIKDVENHAQVEETTPAQRRCRYAGEGGLDVFTKYSYTACVTQCRKKEQLKRCGCVSHHMPNARPEEICDLDGIYCLNKNYYPLNSPKHKYSPKDKIYCECSLSCEDQEIKDVYGAIREIKVNYSIVEVIMKRLPTVRFKRYVIRGKLDLVVSMGGTTGLLVGASLLSFVEVLYYFTLRVCGNDNKNVDDSS